MRKFLRCFVLQAISRWVNGTLIYLVMGISYVFSVLPVFQDWKSEIAILQCGCYIALSAASAASHGKVNYAKK